MRRIGILALVLLGTVFAACGDGPDTPGPTATPADAADTGPVTGLPVLGPAMQELQFLGVVEGTMTDSDASCAWLRDPAGGPGRFQMALQGMVGAQRHSLRVVVQGYTGPGDYSWDGVPGSGPEVTVELDGKERGHATIFVDGSGSGEIQGVITSPSQGRITGVWQCPGTPR